MFERFTDRTKKLMALANQEAKRCNHEYVDTDHVLIALLKEGSGIGATALKNLGANLLRMRSELEKIDKPGFGMVTLGRLPETPQTKKAIEYAVEEARRLNHNYVGTEHILLGLLLKQKNIAGETTARKILHSLGLKLGDVREELMNMLALEVDVKETIPEPSPLARKMVGQTKKLASIIEKKKKESSVKCEFFQAVERVTMNGAREDTYFKPAISGYGRNDVEKKITDFLKDKEFVHSNQSSLVILGKHLIRTTEYTIFYRDKGS